MGPLKILSLDDKMEPYISETYQWLPKGTLFYVITILLSLLIYVAKRLVNQIHDDIMKSIQGLKEELRESVLGINAKLESFDAKFTDINDKLSQQVNLERYVRDTEKIWNEIHYLKERNMILEHIVKLEQSR